MPLPTPRENEPRNEFLARYMADDQVIAHFSDQRDRIAAFIREIRGFEEKIKPDTVNVSDAEIDEALKTYRFFRTAVAAFHWHPMDEGAEFTGPPIGIDDGHRHRILRDDEGLVTGFGESAGHEHEMPPVAEPGGFTPSPSRDEDTASLTLTGFNGDSDWGATGAIHPDQALEVAEFRAKKDDPELFDLGGVEIFRVGTWNGEKYTRDDLDDIVANFAKIGFRPPVKLGHQAASGAPASGWVKSIRRSGEKLVADLMDLPKGIFNAIKARSFDAVSSEIFWNIKRDGKSFRRVLKAVALLGAETPAVSGLKPLRESFSADELKLSHVYAINHQPEAMNMPDKTQAQLEAEATAHAEALTALQTKLDGIVAENAALAAKVKEHADKQQAGDASAVRIQAMAEEIEALQKQNAESLEAARRESIKARANEIKVPAFRSHFVALYDLASRMGSEDGKPRTVLFTVEGEEKETDPMVVIDDLRDRVNKVASGVFLREHTTLGDKENEGLGALGLGPDEDAGTALDRLATAHMAKHNEEDYGKAFSAVLEDPKNHELKARYAGGIQ